jgi:hypothetical protein
MRGDCAVRFRARDHRETNARLGPLCTSSDTAADEQIDACNKIIASNVFPARNLPRFIFGARLEPK